MGGERCIEEKRIYGLSFKIWLRGLFEDDTERSLATERDGNEMTFFQIEVG